MISSPLMTGEYQRLIPGLGGNGEMKIAHDDFCAITS